MSVKDRVLDNLSNIDRVVLSLFNSKNSEPIRNDLFYQKEMFLIVNFLKELKNEADFIPHVFGPYSEAAEISLKNLMSVGLIEKKQKGFKISSFGEDVANKVDREIKTEHKEAIEDFKLFLNDLSNDELLVFIYFSYPDMIRESAIVNKVNKKRLPVSISLYKKGKVSLEKAAFLSGLPIEDFIDIMKQ